MSKKRAQLLDVEIDQLSTQAKTYLCASTARQTLSLQEAGATVGVRLSAELGTENFSVCKIPTEVKSRKLRSFTGTLDECVGFVAGRVDAHDHVEEYIKTKPALVDETVSYAIGKALERQRPYWVLISVDAEGICICHMLDSHMIKRDVSVNEKIGIFDGRWFKNTIFALMRSWSNYVEIEGVGQVDLDGLSPGQAVTRLKREILDMHELWEFKVKKSSTTEEEAEG